MSRGNVPIYGIFSRFEKISTNFFHISIIFFFTLHVNHSPTLRMNAGEVTVKKGNEARRARWASWVRIPHTIIHVVKSSRKNRHT